MKQHVHNVHIRRRVLALTLLVILKHVKLNVCSQVVPQLLSLVLRLVESIPIILNQVLSVHHAQQFKTVPLDFKSIMLCSLFVHQLLAPRLLSQFL
jgi:hypothetical protein